MKIKKLNEMNESNEIPTAEDFMNSKEFEPDRGITYEDYYGESTGIVPSMMVEFAKMHVKEALKAVHSNMQLPDEDLDYIMDSYPLSNIKY